MLDTFTEDRILTAVQELTTELTRLESKVNSGGGGGAIVLECDDLHFVSADELKGTIPITDTELRTVFDKNSPIFIRTEIVGMYDIIMQVNQYYNTSGTYVSSHGSMYFVDAENSFYIASAHILGADENTRVTVALTPA